MSHSTRHLVSSIVRCNDHGLFILRLYQEKFYYSERTFRLTRIYIKVLGHRFLGSGPFYFIKCHHKKKMKLCWVENIFRFHPRYFILIYDYGINAMFRFKTTVTICTFTFTDISMCTHRAFTSHAN